MLTTGGRTDDGYLYILKGELKTGIILFQVCIVKLNQHTKSNYLNTEANQQIELNAF